MKRVATALVLVPLVTWLILAGPEWAFETILAVVGLLAFHEFDKLAAGSGAGRSGIFGMAAGLAFLFAPEPGIVIVVVAIAALAFALDLTDLSLALPTAAAALLGVVYIFGAWKSAIGLHAIDPNWLMYAMLLSWVGDTAALYVGKAFGRHKMAPQVSPGKTWEGAAGSVIGAVLGGWIYAHYLIPTAAMSLVLSLAVAGNVAGQIGDLAESALKRGAGVKDSGSSLPGHGGWLDRIDSSLFTIPVVYALLHLLAP